MTAVAPECQTLTYAEALAAVEQFMVESGIRDFCSNVCGGKCCGSCWKKSPNACHRNEGRRISCSMYLCNVLENFLHVYTLRHLTTVLTTLRQAGLQDCFFTVHTIDIQNRCVFPKQELLYSLPMPESLPELQRRLKWLTTYVQRYKQRYRGMSLYTKVGLRPEDYDIRSEDFLELREKYYKANAA